VRALDALHVALDEPPVRAVRGVVGVLEDVAHRLHLHVERERDALREAVGVGGEDPRLRDRGRPLRVCGEVREDCEARLGRRVDQRRVRLRVVAHGLRERYRSRSRGVKLQTGFYVVADSGMLRAEGGPMAVRTIEWRNGAVVMLDQRVLPTREVYRVYRDHKEVARAIKDMVIRGAPAIGVAAAMGIALGARSLKPG